LGGFFRTPENFTVSSPASSAAHRRASISHFATMRLGASTTGIEMRNRYQGEGDHDRDHKLHGVVELEGRSRQYQEATD